MFLYYAVASSLDQGGRKDGQENGSNYAGKLGSNNWRSERSHSQVIKMEICDIYIYLYTTCDFLLIIIAHAR